MKFRGEEIVSKEKISTNNQEKRAFTQKLSLFPSKTNTFPLFLPLFYLAALRDQRSTAPNIRWSGKEVA